MFLISALWFDIEAKDAATTKEPEVISTQIHVASKVLKKRNM